MGSLTTKFIFEERDGRRRTTPRFLTKRECAAIMGFPPSFVLPTPRLKTRGAAGFGEHEAYRQLGNAVCPPVIQAIGEAMLVALAAAAAAAAAAHAPPPPPPKAPPTPTSDDASSSSDSLPTEDAALLTADMSSCGTVLCCGQLASGPKPLAICMEDALEM